MTSTGKITSDAINHEFGEIRIDPSGAVPLWVDGKAATTSQTMASIQPANGELLAERCWASRDDVSAAVSAAARAAPAWRAMGMLERGERLQELSRRIAARVDDLALIDALDTGSPLRAMRAGALKGAQQLGLNGACGIELHGRTIPASPSGWHLTKLEPFGVVGAISAYNHPTLFACQKMGPALVAGNTVVLKPSEQASISAVAIAALSGDLLPPGVLNVVPGDRNAGESLVSSPLVPRISFTGGVPSGLAVQRTAISSGRIKHVTLELGGKNPMIVFADVDPAAAATAAVKGMNFTRVQGQSCGSTSRLLLHRAIADEVVDLIIKHVEAIRLGVPDDPDTEMGSLVSIEHQRRVLTMIERAAADGATIATGGGVPDAELGLADGAFVVPTVLTNVEPDSYIAQTEVFGPVLSILVWDDLDTALDVANSVDFGLTASVWCNDINAALTTADRLDAGYVWINDVETRYSGVPFGGWKQSGIGSEQALLQEIETYTRSKSINIAVNSAATAPLHREARSH